MIAGVVVFMIIFMGNGLFMLFALQKARKEEKSLLATLLPYMLIEGVVIIVFAFWLFRTL